MQSSIIDKSNKCYNCNNKINSLSFEICRDCDNIFCIFVVKIYLLFVIVIQVLNVVRKQFVVIVLILII